MQKYNNKPIKGYAMGDYQYEWGAMFEYQKRDSSASIAKAELMSAEEITYWQAYFYKKYNGHF